MRIGFRCICEIDTYDVAYLCVLDYSRLIHATAATQEINCQDSFKAAHSSAIVEAALNKEEIQ